MKRLLLFILSLSLLLTGCKKQTQDEDIDTSNFEKESPYVEVNTFDVESNRFIDENYYTGESDFNLSDLDYLYDVNESALDLYAKVTIIGDTTESFITESFHDYKNDLIFESIIDDSGNGNAIYKVDGEYYVFQYSNDNTMLFKYVEPEYVPTLQISNAVDLLLDTINSELLSSEAVTLSGNPEEFYYKCIFKNGILYTNYGTPFILVCKEEDKTLVFSISFSYTGLNESMFHLVDDYQGDIIYITNEDNELYF